MIVNCMNIPNYEFVEVMIPEELCWHLEEQSPYAREEMYAMMMYMLLYHKMLSVVDALNILHHTPKELSDIYDAMNIPYMDLDVFQRKNDKYVEDKEVDK